MPKTCHTLALILGDQLDANYPEALGLDRKRDVLLMVEVASASQQPASHVQRTVLFLSAMRHHAKRLKDDGWRVAYHRLTDGQNTQTFRGELSRAIDTYKPQHIACIEPGSYEVLDEIESACGEKEVSLRLEPDPHFLCSLDEFNAWADDGRKELVLEYFYRTRRKKLGVLMDENGKPVGGGWNFDKENRNTFKQAPDPPLPLGFEPDTITREVIKDVKITLPGLPGRLGGFDWPVTRDDALITLDDFIEHRLPRFGDYQDAMWSGQHTLYHSLLSSSLNLKLLSPREVVDAAIKAYESGKAPINAVEGFVRQIIGWREFIRGVYFHEGRDYVNRNKLKQHGSLPGFYWSGETDMACMHDALTSVLDLAYGHHIARLMVTGNFALIAGIDPKEVNDWYLGMFADGVEWVTVPNTVGMAMHADGGVVGTKPYASSGKYIQRMSNYCKACPYDINQRTGEKACPFNTFYWDFLIKNESKFKRNRRMSMILKHVEKMDKQERVDITTSAKRLRKKFGITSSRAD